MPRLVSRAVHCCNKPDVHDDGPRALHQVRITNRQRHATSERVTNERKVALVRKPCCTLERQPLSLSVKPCLCCFGNQQRANIRSKKLQFISVIQRTRSSGSGFSSPVRGVFRSSATVIQTHVTCWDCYIGDSVVSELRFASENEASSGEAGSCGRKRRLSQRRQLLRLGGTSSAFGRRDTFFEIRGL